MAKNWSLSALEIQPDETPGNWFPEISIPSARLIQNVHGGGIFEIRVNNKTNDGILFTIIANDHAIARDKNTYDECNDVAIYYNNPPAKH